MDNIKKWYEKYPKLNHALFTVANSGNAQHMVCPYGVRDGELRTYINHWKIVGYTLNPPFCAGDFEAVAIMFEDETDFEKLWFHFLEDLQL